MILQKTNNQNKLKPQDKKVNKSRYPFAIDEEIGGRRFHVAFATSLEKAKESVSKLIKQDLRQQRDSSVFYVKRTDGEAVNSLHHELRMWEPYVQKPIIAAWDYGPYIVDIEYGIEDKVILRSEDGGETKGKTIHYDESGRAYINVFRQRFYIDEALRTNIGGNCNARS